MLGLTCSTWNLKCCVWDLVAWRGIEPRPPCIGSSESQPLDHHRCPRQEQISEEGVQTGQCPGPWGEQRGCLWANPQKAADCCQGEGWLRFSGGTESRMGEPGPLLVLGSPSVASAEESIWGERSRGRRSPRTSGQTAEGWFRDQGKRIPDAHTLFDFFKHWRHTSVSSLLSCWSVCLFELQFLLAQGVLFPCVFHDLSIYLGEFFEAWCCHHLSPLAGHSKVQCVRHWQCPSSVSLKRIAVAWALEGQQEERSQS